MKNDKCEIYVDKDGELVVKIIRGKGILRTYKVDDLKIRNSYWKNVVIK